MLVHTAWCELVRRLNVVFKGYLQLRVKTTLGMYVFRRFPTHTDTALSIGGRDNKIVSIPAAQAVLQL